MELARGTTRIYRCPICQADTPHIVQGRRGSIYGILCGNCRGGSLVPLELLATYRVRWADELREVFDGPGDPDDA